MLQVSVPIAHELLAQYVNQGHALVQRASLVGDFSDYESWKAARNQWIEPTVQALDHVYGDSEQAQDFKSVVTPSKGGQRWQQQYAIDLDCVKAAIDLLTVLQGELAFARTDEGAPRPAAELAAGDAPHDERHHKPGGVFVGGDAWHRPDGVPESPPLASGSAQHAAGAAEGAPRGPDAPHAGATPDAAGATPDAAVATDGVLASQGAPEPAPAEQPARPAEPLQRLAEDAGAQSYPSIAAQPESSIAAEPEPSVSAETERTVSAELSPAPIVGAELAPHANGVMSAAPAGSLDAVASGSKQVFLAHGRNEKWKQAVASLLEQAGPHEIMILNDRPSERGTLVEQFGARAPGSRYAVVLLTADDVGAPRLESEQEPYFSPRARQGVVFEMGFLVAALTPGRVCVLYEDGVELPCDLEGIAYVRLDLAGTWQPKLLLHLRKAGFDYDVNRLAAV